MHSKRTTTTIRTLLVFGITAIGLIAYGSAASLRLDASLHGSFFSLGSACPEALLCVDFLDVGQGDATLITTPDNMQILIDGGADASVLRGLGERMHFFDRDINVLIATHPDLDHIGGFLDVLERYTVGTVILTENEHDTPVAQAFLEKVTETESSLVYARSGQHIPLGADTALYILFPDRDPTHFESNTASIVTQLRHGNIDVLMTGDAPAGVEEYLVTQYGEALQSEVLKVGHHGSKTATSPLFVQTVRPEVGVISAGRANRYGHPHEVVLETLHRHNVITKNTAEVGSISLVSDGTTFWFR